MWSAYAGVRRIKQVARTLRIEPEAVLAAIGLAAANVLSDIAASLTLCGVVDVRKRAKDYVRKLLPCQVANSSSREARTGLSTSLLALAVIQSG